MWSLFGKIMSYDFPDRFAGLLTKEQYAELLREISKYFKNLNIKHDYLGDGIFGMKNDQYVGQIAVDNLIRTIIKLEKADWPKEISHFLDKHRINEADFENLFINFELAKPQLRVLIKHNSFDLSRPDSKQIARIDFPETYTLLALELDGKFLFLTEANIKNWNKTISELYSIAIENTPYNEIRVFEYKFEFGSPTDSEMIYILESGDYAASAMLDLKGGGTMGVGKFGSLVTIPSKGKAYCYAINGGDIARLAKAISLLSEKDYNSEPGNISTNFYWVYQNHVEIIQKIDSTDSGFKIPNRLIDMMRPN
jgi:hypothetical protein